MTKYFRIKYLRCLKYCSVFGIWPVRPAADTECHTHVSCCHMSPISALHHHNISSNVTNVSSAGLGSWMEAFLRIFPLSISCWLQGRDNYIMSVWAASQLSFSTWIIHGLNISKRQLLRPTFNKCCCKYDRTFDYIWVYTSLWFFYPHPCYESDHFEWESHRPRQSKMSQTGCDLCGSVITPHLARD